ncbi:MAG: imidazoleglycerol-phosphate dehydratase HisB [Spirochaetaceae bacterium]|nr:MAG: imidazoleglycerol-phosphate dehydratase HisB [Spirochaetaceae bacterium]
MSKASGRTVEYSRKTRETEISLELGFEVEAKISIDTGVPFFDHVLQAMAFHGHFGFNLKARGDIEVDEHHLIEDTGIVFGEALNRVLGEYGPVQRYGQATIPMDEALSEVVIDVCGRSFLVFTGTFPQERIGSFQAILLHEFLSGLANRGRMAVHAHLRYGSNSHHMAESLFKALGVAISGAYTLAEPGTFRGDAGRRDAGLTDPSVGMSTKGTLD